MSPLSNLGEIQMKKIATIVAALAVLTSNGAYAQQAQKPAPAPTTNGAAKPQTGNGAAAATYSTYDDFSWGIGLGALVIVGVVVGVTVAGALGSQSSHSH